MQIDFNGLKAEKRQSILNAALGEFADKGYALASTNGIVRRAGISKGALSVSYTHLTLPTIRLV